MNAFSMLWGRLITALQKNKPWAVTTGAALGMVTALFLSAPAQTGSPNNATTANAPTAGAGGAPPQAPNAPSSGPGRPQPATPTTAGAATRPSGPPAATPTTTTPVVAQQLPAVVAPPQTIHFPTAPAPASSTSGAVLKSEAPVLR